MRFTADGEARLRQLCAEAESALLPSASAARAQLAGTCDWTAAVYRLMTFTPRAATDVASLQSLAADAIEYIEAASLLWVPSNVPSAANATTPPAPPPAPPALRTALLPQLSPPWHLDRLDNMSLPLDNLYAPPQNACGEGAHIFLLDTGIVATHVEFTGRLGNGFNGVDDGSGVNNTADCHGHGTHTAGVAGGGQQPGGRRRARHHIGRQLGWRRLLAEPRLRIGRHRRGRDDDH